MSDFRVELTGDQMHIIKLALRAEAVWYDKYGNGDAWYSMRAKENRELVEYLDQQMPLTSSDGSK